MVATFPVKIKDWATNPAISCIRWHRLGNIYAVVISDKQAFCQLYGNVAARWQKQFKNYEFVRHNASHELFLKGSAYMYSHRSFSPETTDEEAKQMRIAIVHANQPSLNVEDTEFQFDLSPYSLSDEGEADADAYADADTSFDKQEQHGIANSSGCTAENCRTAMMRRQSVESSFVLRRYYMDID
jgi:hypothetical protein